MTTGGKGRIARDGEELPFHGRGQDWLVSWHPPGPPPSGRRHGSAVLCLTDAGYVVLVREQPEGHWGLPGGRPQGDEDWRATLDREVLEEACAAVDDAVLLGYSRGLCVAGHEEGLVIVRALWLALVTLHPFEPRHEICERRLAVPADLLTTIELPDSEPIHRRLMHEAAARPEGRVLRDAGWLSS